MTPHEQRIALAKACGWYRPGGWEGRLHHPTTLRWADDAPDYLNDLNAVADAEKTLTDDQMAAYASHLSFILYHDYGMRGDKQLYGRITATAAQRTKSLLLTLGLWRQ